MPFGRRIKTIEPPEPVNPITGRPYNYVPPEPVDERDLAARAAGQRALATAVAPPHVPSVGYNPRASAWRGCDDIAVAKRARGE